jgi:uncharacterized protein (UPF0548 family)
MPSLSAQENRFNLLILSDSRPARKLWVHVCGLWSLNACRIVYVVKEQRRFGFAYGTLPAHAESGEERFTVEWRQEDNSVWYDILAFSRPRELLSRLGCPFVRKLQKRFARESAVAMLRAVAQDTIGWPRR